MAPKGLIQRQWKYLLLILSTVHLAKQSEMVTNDDLLQLLTSQFVNLDHRLSNIEDRLSLMDQALVDIKTDLPALAESTSENLVLMNRAMEEIHVLKLAQIKTNNVFYNLQENVFVNHELLKSMKYETMEKLNVVTEKMDVIVSLPNESKMLSKNLTEVHQIVTEIQSDTIACESVGSTCFTYSGTCRDICLADETESEMFNITCGLTDADCKCCQKICSISGSACEGGSGTCRDTCLADETEKLESKLDNTCGWWNIGCKCCEKKCSNSGSVCGGGSGTCRGICLNGEYPSGICDGPQCHCCKTIPAGFEEYNWRVIRRTTTSDPFYDYDTAMRFCDRFNGKPFIPRREEDYELYNVVALSLDGSGWLPADDREEEGVLRWYNGEVDTNVGLWKWYEDEELHYNSASRDCLFYGRGGGPIILMYGCDYNGYPPICEII